MIPDNSEKFIDPGKIAQNYMANYNYPLIFIEFYNKIIIL